MRYPIAIVFVLLLFKAQMAFAQASCFTPLEQSYYQAEGIFGYRFFLQNAPIPTYGPKLPATNTGYQFVAGTPGPGQYTIIRDTRGMNPNSWYEIDTRTDPNDGTYMLVMNASTLKTNQFYQYILGAFCPKTKYTVTVWVYNLSKSGNGTPLNFTFKLSTLQGDQRLVYNTGDIAGANPGWINYDMTFTTPDVKEDLQITITNNNPGSASNVFAMDNVRATIYQPTINTLLDADNSNAITACSGADYSFPMHVAITNNYAHPRYQWQQQYNRGSYYDLPGETNITYTAKYTHADAGIIRYRLSAAEGDNIDCSDCRSYAAPVTVTIAASPAANVIANIGVCEGEALSLNPLATNTLQQTYQWTGPDNFTSTQADPIIPVASFANAGTYHVIIKNTAPCTTEADVTVKVYPKITVSASSDVEICQGSSTSLNATGSPGVSYSWSPAVGLSDVHSASITVSPANTTTYTVTISNASNCSATASVTVKVLKPPTISAGNDVTITEGDKLMLNGDVKGDNVTYYWTPASYLSNSNSLTPAATPTSDITYTLHGLSDSHCGGEITDNVTIHVFKKVTVPNTFSPNNDGVNDTWNIRSLEYYPGCRVQVFNRYGQAVFSSINYPKSWDGKTNGRPLNNGTYYYMIDLKNGKILSGWVAIVK